MTDVRQRNLKAVIGVATRFCERSGNAISVKGDVSTESLLMARAARKARKKDRKEKVQKNDPKKRRAKKSKKTKNPKVIESRELARRLAARHDLSKATAISVLDGAFHLIADHLRKGARINLRGLGQWGIKARVGSVGHNPMTNEKVDLKVSKKIRFRPSKQMAKRLRK